MFNLDAAVTHAINAAAGRSPLIDSIMVGVSTAAVPLLIAIVALQWWGPRTSRERDRHTIVAAGLTFGLGLLLNQLVLLFIQRPRPYSEGITHLLIAPSTDPSFPSDHATASFAIAAAFLLNGAPRRGVCFALAALLVSYSRVFIGTHYVSDVAGGWLTAFLAAVAVTVAYRRGTSLDSFLVKLL